MSKSYTLASAFADFGAKGANPRWSWSARSEDGKMIVLALWQDEFEFVKDEKKHKYHSMSTKEDVAKDLGNKERLENLKWAKDHCGGVFHVVILIAKDKDSRPKEIAECFPQHSFAMKLEQLDENTGEFHAVSIKI